MNYHALLSFLKYLRYNFTTEKYSFKQWECQHLLFKVHVLLRVPDNFMVTYLNTHGYLPYNAEAIVPYNTHADSYAPFNTHADGYAPYNTHGYVL